MEDVVTAEASAKAVGDLTAAFMLDGQTYKTGAGHGFAGLDFYVSGRCGVLGEPDADVVTAAMVFWNPTTVREQWEASAAVMSRNEASALFARCLADWADRRASDSVDWGRLGELAAGVSAAASVAGAPLFAGWRSMPAPDDARVAALHHMNCLRELRMARHGSAVLAVGLDPADAVRYKSPGMAAMYGWSEAELAPEIADRWAEAEALTNRATAVDYSVLSSGEAEEFIRLSNAAIGG